MLGKSLTVYSFLGVVDTSELAGSSDEKKGHLLIA